DRGRRTRRRHLAWIVLAGRRRAQRRLHDLLTMATKPPKPAREFGTRRPSVPVAPQPGPPAKRSGHVALLLMGTFAVGTAAYALMPSRSCEQSPNVASPSLQQGNTDCSSRSSSSSHGGSGSGTSSRSSYYSSDSSSS